MPKVAFLVPASPNAGFYSQIAALNLALKKLSWGRWEPELCVTMGARSFPADVNDAFERWLDYVKDFAFSYVSQTRWERMNNWAQVDATLLNAPRDADVYVTLDADTLPVANLEAVLEAVRNDLNRPGFVGGSNS
jgi:arginase family enzyme